MDLQDLKHRAEVCMKQGNLYDLQGDPAKAEQQYLEALKIQEALLKNCGDDSCRKMAGEICEILADLNMQQGNMHGADVYYVKAFSYQNP